MLLQKNCCEFIWICSYSKRRNRSRKGDCKAGSMQLFRSNFQPKIMKQESFKLSSFSFCHVDDYYFWQLSVVSAVTSPSTMNLGLFIRSHCQLILRGRLRLLVPTILGSSQLTVNGRKWRLLAHLPLPFTRSTRKQ